MRISISKVVESQLPSFVKEDYPLFPEFLKQYYISDDSERLIQNLDKNIDLDVLFKVKNETKLTTDVFLFDNVINVESTDGFPDEYGLIKIDNEIILYTRKNETQFLNCVRGFSGISKIDKQSLEFEETEADYHTNGVTVFNLSGLFLQIFAMNIKKRISPGFEDRDLFNDLNKSNFLKSVKSFYTSKGSDESFRILFGALYGKSVEVVKPRDFLIRSSDAQYRFTKDIVVEVINGDPYELLNSTIYQDSTDNLEPAQGTVAEINKIIRNNKDYFILGLDFDYNKDSDVSGTLKSEFTIHPKTIVTHTILANSTYIDVDSTIGFPDKGQLQINLSDGNTLTVIYQDKTLNQFLECSGIDFDIPEETQVKTFDYIYGFAGDGSQVTMRVNGVLGDIDYISNTNYYVKDDIIEILTLGENSKLFKANNWFFNIGVKYNVERVEIKDISDLSYRIITLDTNNFVIGDSFTLYSSDGLKYFGRVIFIEDENSLIIRGQGQLNINLTYKIQKNISKVNVNNVNYQYLNQYNSNVQNVYLDYDNNIYVSSPSLPNYYDYPLDIKDFTLKIPARDYTNIEEIAFNTPHGKYTGDAVVYKPINDDNKIIEFNVYYVKKIDDYTIKLARSLYNVYNGSFVRFNGAISSGFESILEPLNFNDVELNKLQIKPQNLINQLKDPEILNEEQETEVGPIGILVNGVEVCNFKSEDVIFYGGIESIDIISGGSGYNVLNPPEITISDPVGSGASIFAAVEGALERIDIIDPGFDYIEQPIIKISGGNGVGASASAELIEFIHSVEFNSETLVDLTEDTIETLEDHKFRNYEEIIYKTVNQKNVTGLSTNSTYFVNILDERRVKLHFTQSDAVSGINTINLSGIGTGIHQLVSTQIKKKLSKIKVNNPGSGYKNKKVRISGINTASNEFTVVNHNYSSGEIIAYYPENQPISGITSSTSYYVTVVDANSLKLSEISSGNRPDIEYERKNYINLTSPEFSGNHFFNYPKIEVTITGKIGITTLPGQDFSAKLQPVFSGRIFDTFLDEKGTNYGSEEVINFERKPSIFINTGINAQLTPIISNGSISRVVVNSSGSNYQQIPDIIVTPSQSDIELTPILSNGRLIEVKVINGGRRLIPEQTKIEVVAKEKNAKFEPKIKFRRINTVERLIQSNNISKDDGYISRRLDSLQYTHLYSPRSLRESILRKNGDTNVKDLIFRSEKEQISVVHSPLLGWAYDGNPIYGPYGYKNGNSGPAVALKSGYELKTEAELQSENRPSLLIYPIGFFVDDYKFTGNGDLDEHNGRYCITPEFPNGVYAYFCTISDVIADSSTPFFNYYAPVFPYIIGNTFRNKFNKISYNIESLGDKLLRNTSPYNFTKNNSEYNYTLNPNKSKIEKIKIEKTKNSKVDSFKILNPGKNYKVNDRVLFNDGGTARVSSISGVAVTSVGVSYTSIYNVEVIPYKNQFIGISSHSHDIQTAQIFKFNSPQEINKSVTVVPVINSLILSSAVLPTSITGIITYFNVSGNFQFPLKENDIFTINDEDIKILNVESDLSRIRVEREQNGTSGIDTHQVNSILRDKSRKFTFNLGISTTYNFKENKEYYFNPSETVGLGTEGNNTLTLKNPGTGKTTLTVPAKAIYIKNNELLSGDSIFYSINGGNSIQVSVDGIGSTTLSSLPELYVTKLENNLISISSERSGVGSTDKILYFTGIGTGDNHSFKTNYDNTLVGNFTKNTVIVSTSSTHGMSLGDNISINVSSGIETTYKVYYNSINRRICLDKKDIESVNVVTNTINVPDHKFSSGDKVIYVSTSPVGGLESEELYYVVYVNKDSFKLSQTYYNCFLNIPVIIDLTSTGNGYFYAVNPKIEIIKNQDIIFDTSDSSLSFDYGGNKYPAFELKIYKTKDLVDEYNTYDLVKSGIVGVDASSNYKLSSANLPETLYYKFIPINTDISPTNKKEIYFDNYSDKSGQLQVVNSEYSGNYSLSGVGTTSFSYIIDEYPEKNYYNNSSVTVVYTTTSVSANGPINQVKLINSRIVNTIPIIKEIISDNGSNAVIKVESNDIGKIEKVKKLDIGFNYSKDYTIRPKLSLPRIIEVVPTYKLDSVGVQTRGYGYSYSPNLIVLDNTDNTVYNNIKFNFDIFANKIQILENNDVLKTKDIKIVSIDNDNGFQIDTIDFNYTSKEVTVKLRTGFNTITDYPFNEGDLVFIEGVPKSNNSILGYNSSEYGYRSFKIIASTPNIGGIGATFVYSLEGLISSTQLLSPVDSTYTSGVAIPESYLTTFNVNIKNNEFIKNETVKFSVPGEGRLADKNLDNNQIKIFTGTELAPGDIIYGQTSKNYSTISNIYFSDAFISIDSSSDVSRGWKDNVGFLNDTLQRIHDSNYYQYFSYDLKSEVDFSDWSDLVDSLNHTAGFKKFGNLLINSEHKNVGLSTNQNLGEVEQINDLYSQLDVNCFSDFDLVTENYFNVNGNLRSNEIYFNSRRLQNYIESVNNKVILIDDISDKFKPVDIEESTVVDVFNSNSYRFKKYILHIFDRLNPSNTQGSVLNLLHDNNTVGISQYAIVNSGDEIGYFDSDIVDFDVRLLFSPIIKSSKIYSINSFAYNLSESSSGVGTVLLGDTATLTSYSTTAIGSTVFASIPATNTAAKLLVLYSDLENQIFYSDEINYIHDGTNIIYNQYNEIKLGSSAGIGTYNIFYDGSNVNIELNPNSTSEYQVDAFSIQISDTSSTTTDLVLLSGNKVESTITSITATGSPVKSLIYSHDSNFTSGLHQIVIEDTDNNLISYYELFAVLNSSVQQVNGTDFGYLNTLDEFGVLEIGYSLLGELEIYFTPFDDINYQVRMVSTLTSKYRRSEILEI